MSGINYEEIMFEPRDVYDKYNFDENLNSFTGSVSMYDQSQYVENDQFNRVNCWQ